MKKKHIQLIPQDEELSIRLLIASTGEDQVKLGLIRLCECYQKGQLLSTTKTIRDSLRSFIFDKDNPEIARWALKIIAEMRNPEDHEIIRARLITPPDNDVESLAWTVVAYHAVANPSQIQEAYDNKILHKDAVAIIAHELAEIDGVIPSDLPRIDIGKADDILLKCACVCIGTNRNKRGIFDPKFDQQEQLIALNGHHSPEVSQYSIYAMCRLPGVYFEHLDIPMDQLFKKSLPVRRWANRLFTKRSQSVVRNQDFLKELIDNEQEGAALEGLALGLKPIWYDGIDVPVVNWYQTPQEDRVRIALLEHMARQSDHSNSYTGFVLDEYRNADSDLLRARLKEAAQRTKLYGTISSLEQELIAKQGSLFVTVQQGGIFNLTKNVQKISGGNVNIGVNTLGGDSVSNKVDQRIDLNQDMRKLTVKLRESIQGAKVTKESKEVIAALEDLEKEPTKNKLTSVMEKAKNLLATGALGAEAIAYAKEFIDAAGSLLGS